MKRIVSSLILLSIDSAGEIAAREKEWDSPRFRHSRFNRYLNLRRTVIRRSGKYRELMRYFSPAKGPARNLTGNLRSRCTAIWLSRPGEHELVENSKTSRITTTGGILDDSAVSAIILGY